MSLKYLFQVTYKNGSTFLQSQEDKSITKPGGSAFSDVVVDQVKDFFLIGTEHTYAVSLLDGHFEIDGIPFWMHKEEHLTGFRLIYFRGVKITQDMKFKLGEQVGATSADGQKTFDIAEHELVGEPTKTTSFNIGWECDFNGKTYREVMQIF